MCGGGGSSGGGGGGGGSAAAGYGYDGGGGGGDDFSARQPAQRMPLPQMPSVAAGMQPGAAVSPAASGVRIFDAMGFGESRRRDLGVTPDIAADASVTRQEFAPIVGGGEPGVGSQGFGARALIGGEGELIQPIDPQSFSDPSNTMPAIAPPSDVAMDPNYVEPSPGQAPISDVRYNIPFINAGPGAALIPNSRNAAARVAGPISRGLMSARSGFGRAFM